ncbi:hypothetical protein VNO77_34102 [Canavalia gladiata]|uniref:Uncharacterized protein n=1 Tax=Canavalia gladiata TaxID=3824 RepID=A0AAN9KD30_CANGL
MRRSSRSYLEGRLKTPRLGRWLGQDSTLDAPTPASVEIYLWPRSSRNLPNVFPTIPDVTMENRKPPERPGEFLDGDQLLLLSPSSSSFPFL